MDSSTEQHPIKIEHFIDTDIDPKTGEYLYSYNYLLYTFEHASGQITARSYLDDISKVSLLRHPSSIDIRTELAGILSYLRARYQYVKYLDQDGYIEI